MISAVFTVPTTHDMVSQLFDPSQPKNLSDLVVIGVLGAHILLAFLLPAGLKQPVFMCIYLLWRAAYNAGIGLILQEQSRTRFLVVWARHLQLFEDPELGHNPRPWLYKLLKRELEAKIPENYKMETAPIEYNTWLVFRRLVDLILMCDFVSYCLFAIVAGHRPEGESLVVAVCRWTIGLGLVYFNLWVKLDAHRVVKDFAWYWGDFFFLVDQELTFDGVFEMAPHPMYSIGYAGYYGISMMAGSYAVLSVSIAAHLAQMIFLVLVENPHIEKTYNPPAPRKRTASPGQLSESRSELSLADKDSASVHGQRLNQKYSPSSTHNLGGVTNVDLYRVADYAVILLLAYTCVFTTTTATNDLIQNLFFLHAVAWRVWYHLGLGYILRAQSESKLWTRHFVKYGESEGEGWRQWKGMCHLSMIMCYASTVAAAWKMYAVPESWSDDWIVLKHILGGSLVALQIWAACSIYESLGEFGWFFGDFFFDHEAKLTYTSIYRFLNNPERVFGSAGIWGAALITRSRNMFLLAMISQLFQIAFIELVEKPHMKKVYGRKLRREAGLTKFFKKTLPPPVKTIPENVDKVFDDTGRFVEDFLDSARPKFAAGVKSIVRDTSALFNLAPARLTLTRLAPGVQPDQSMYSIAVDGTPISSAMKERATGKESLTARFPKDVRTTVYEYGAPIKVTWTAPVSHGKKDWIGLYMVTDNRSRDATEVSSLGRWAPTTAGSFDFVTADSSILVQEQPVSTPSVSEPRQVQGQVVFSGDKLWWTQGVLEFRYHHNDTHTVMAISQPFEIRIGKFDTEDVYVDDSGTYENAVAEALLPIVQNCLDRDPDIAPSTVDEPFGGHVERGSKYAKRLVYVVHQMFGVEFAPAVVPADGNVRKLAWRICNAKKVLVSISVCGRDDGANVSRLPTPCLNLPDQRPRLPDVRTKGYTCYRPTALLVWYTTEQKTPRRRSEELPWKRWLGYSGVCEK